MNIILFAQNGQNTIIHQFMCVWVMNSISKVCLEIFLSIHTLKVEPAYASLNGWSPKLKTWAPLHCPYNLALSMYKTIQRNHDACREYAWMREVVNLFNQSITCALGKLHCFTVTHAKLSLVNAPANTNTWVEFSIIHKSQGCLTKDSACVWAAGALLPKWLNFFKQVCMLT